MRLKRCMNTDKPPLIYYIPFLKALPEMRWSSWLRLLLIGRSNRIEIEMGIEIEMPLSS